MEEVFLGDPFNVGEEGTGEMNFSTFVQGLVYVSDFDGNVKLCGGKGVFSDQLPVDARDVCTTVDQGTSVNDF